MLDSKILRQDPAAVRDALAIKGYDFDVERYNALEAARKDQQTQTESLQNERNQSSKAIGKAKAAGEDIQPLLDKVASLGDELDSASRQERRGQQRVTPGG